MSTILDEIFAHKRETLPQDEGVRRSAREQAESSPKARGFRSALLKRQHPVGLIAEVKKASPSEGLIRSDFDPKAICQAYESAGADCLSVLTDVRYFQGSVQNMLICRSACDLPILRKDFTADEFHVYEARAMGADAILLILAMLDPAAAREYHQLAKELGMDVLVEVHTPGEAEKALQMEADLIGVNNRDLKTFQTSLAISREIIPMLGNAVKVSESALSRPEDINEAQAVGADAVLIGTAFCREPDIEAAVKRMMDW